MSTIFHPDFAQLAEQVGELVARGDSGFAEALSERIWNQRLARERQPAAIVCVRDAGEAMQAVRFARGNGLKLTVRGHGHNYEAAAARDGTIMLDIAPLNSLEIDRTARTAWAGAAVSGGELLKATEPLGLAFPIGHCSNVPLSGYVLSGGFGWNAGAWGPASANVLAIELVTAAGEHLCVDAEHHSDLFWAARGSGSGFFAAALRYKLKLHDLPTTAFTWSATFEAAAAPALTEWLSDATFQSDPEAEIICLVGPDHHSGKPAAIVRASATADSVQEARAKVAAFRDPPVDAVAIIEGPKAEELDFHELTKLSAMPNGKRVKADQLWSSGTLGEMLLAVHHLADRPAKTSSINLVSPGGGATIPRCGNGGCALSVGGGAAAGIYAMWDDADDDERHFAWVSEVDAALAPFRAGRYVGEADLSAAPDRVAQCFSGEALNRIEHLRTEWDPDNIFGGFPTG